MSENQTPELVIKEAKTLSGIEVELNYLHMFFECPIYEIGNNVGIQYIIDKYQMPDYLIAFLKSITVHGWTVEFGTFIIEILDMKLGQESENHFFMTIFDVQPQPADNAFVLKLCSSEIVPISEVYSKISSLPFQKPVSAYHQMQLAYMVEQMRKRDVREKCNNFYRKKRDEGTDQEELQLITNVIQKMYQWLTMTKNTCELIAFLKVQLGCAIQEYGNVKNIYGIAFHVPEDIEQAQRVQEEILSCMLHGWHVITANGYCTDIIETGSPDDKNVRTIVLDVEKPFIESPPLAISDFLEIQEACDMLKQMAKLQQVKFTPEQYNKTKTACVKMQTIYTQKRLNSINGFLKKQYAENKNNELSQLIQSMEKRVNEVRTVDLKITEAWKKRNSLEVQNKE